MSDTLIPRAPAKGRPPTTSGEVSRRSPAVDAALARSLFVIPSINGGSLLRRMLPTLRLPPHIVVVLDQGSIDDTEVVCRAAGVRLVQLGRPYTYTEASNIGARMAREESCDFVFISNNDIAFTTDVGAELLAEMLDDPRLGIVAPSQVIVDERVGRGVLANRAEWHLDTMLFTHDVRALGEDVGRLEADLCELTCAAIRIAAVADIGFLDDDFGFYYEDADFCFRLRQAGYSCAYLPRSQIEHYTSSTFSAGLSGRKRAYMARNVELFAGKHLGYGFGRLSHARDSEVTTGGIARHLPRYLQRFGLLDRARPGLVYGAPGTAPLDYLYVDWKDDFRSDRMRSRLSAYRGLVARSEWSRQRFHEAGFETVGFASNGVETDIFHPWAAPVRPFDETTILWSGHNDAAAALDVLLEAWAIVRSGHPDARLIIMGSGVLACLSHAPASIRRWHNQTIADFPEERISLRHVTAPMSDEAWASLYRGVDVVVSTRLHPDPGLAAAMACGTLAVFTTAGSGRELAFPGALVYGDEAGRSGSGGSDAAWRPDVGALVASLREALAIDDGARRDLGRRALPLIRSRFTWRSTCAGLNEVLADWQEPSRIGAALRRRWEEDMDALTCGDGEVVYDAVTNASGLETGETVLLALPVARSRPPQPVAATPDAPTSPSDAEATDTGVPPPQRRLVREARRAWRAGWSIGSMQRGKRSRAALAMIRGSLSRQARLRLRGLLVRSGLLPPRH